MKKDLIFTPLMLVDVVLLFLLKVTGLPAHIAVSVAGIAILAAYTALTKNEWKIPVMELIMRACYGIALISGIVVMNVEGIAAVAIAHKVSAALFAIVLIVLFVLKLRSKKA